MNMQAMLRQAQNLQKDMLKAKEEVDSTEFSGESSFVKVTMKGTKELISVEISADSLDSDDIEALEDMILVAINEANKKIDLANKQRRVAETRNTELEAKVDRLQAELDYYKALLEGGDDISTNNS